MCNRFLCAEHMLCDTLPLKLIPVIQHFTCLLKLHLSSEGCALAIVLIHCYQTTIILFFADGKKTTDMPQGNKGDTNSFLLFSWISLTISAQFFSLPCTALSPWLLYHMHRVYLLMIISRVSLAFLCIALIIIWWR